MKVINFFTLTGKYCEYQTAVTFVDKGSFIQLKAPSMKAAVNLTIKFMTKAQDGVLVYHGQQQNRPYLAVEMFRGRLRISYDVGNHPASTMFR